MEMANTEAKFREMILYVCLNSEVDPDFGATKLNKLLFYMDLESLKATGRTISGQAYQKLQHGPVPRAMQHTLRSMESDGDLATRSVPVGEFSQQKSFALREPDLGYFTAEDIAIMNAVVKQFEGVNARAISDKSHEFLGWKVVGYGDTIPLGSVFISDRSLTAAEQAYAKELVGLVGARA